MQLKTLVALFAGVSAVSAAVVPRSTDDIKAKLDSALTAVVGFNTAVEAFNKDPSAGNGALILGPQQALGTSLTDLTTAITTDKQGWLSKTDSADVGVKLYLVGLNVSAGLKDVAAAIGGFKNLGVQNLVAAGLQTLDDNWKIFTGAASKKILDADWNGDNLKGIRASIEAQTKDILAQLTSA